MLLIEAKVFVYKATTTFRMYKVDVGLTVDYWIRMSLKAKGSVIIRTMRSNLDRASNLDHAY